MTLPKPARPGDFTEQLPKRVTHTIDRDSNAGLAEAVDEYLHYSDVSPGEARRIIVAVVSSARAGDVVQVGPVRVHVR